MRSANRKQEHENYAETNLSFPHKLYAMLVREDGGTIQWSPHGLAFKINDQYEFTRKVIPKYFKHSKLTSFQRQLNLYGFRRQIKGDDSGAYFHAKFQRDHPELVDEIVRLPRHPNSETLEELIAARNLPGGKPVIPRKRVFNSHWVTPVRETAHRTAQASPCTGATATDASKHTSKRQKEPEPVDYDEGFGYYRTRRLAKKEESLLSSSSSSADNANNGQSAQLPEKPKQLPKHRAAQVTPATNHLGMPLLRIPSPRQQQSHTVYHGTRSTVTANIGFAAPAPEVSPPQRFLWSPAVHAHGDDFSDLCPDLIGSPHFGRMMLGEQGNNLQANLLATVSADFEQMPSPTGLSALPSPFARNVRTLGQTTAGMTPAFTARTPAWFPQSTSAAQPSVARQHNTAATIAPTLQAVPAAVDVSPESQDMATQDNAAAQQTGGQHSECGPFTATLVTAEQPNSEPEGEDSWLTGHSADALDQLLDMICPTFEAPVSFDGYGSSSSSAGGGLPQLYGSGSSAEGGGGGGAGRGGFSALSASMGQSSSGSEGRASMSTASVGYYAPQSASQQRPQSVPGLSLLSQGMFLSDGNMEPTVRQVQFA